MRVPFRWPLLVALLVALCCPALAASSASAASLPLTFKEVARTSLTAGSPVMKSTNGVNYGWVGFVGDHALVQEEGTDAWGLMDSSGEVPGGYTHAYKALPDDWDIPQVSYLTCAGVYSAREVEYDETTKKDVSSFTLLDRDGKTLGTYSDVKEQSTIHAGAGPFCGLICVQDQMTGKWGYIDTSGKRVTDFAYDSAELFSYGYAVVGTKDADGAMRYGLIDTSGDVVIAPDTYSGLGDCSEEGMVAFSDASTNKGGYLKVADGKATVAIQPTSNYYRDFYYNWGEMFHEGLAIVRGDQSSSGELSVIDTSGAVRFTFTGSPYGSFADGYLAVNDYKRSDGTTGDVYLDANGNVAIDKGFDTVVEFQDGYACVGTQVSACAFIDTSGNLVNAGKYDLIGVESTAKTGLVWVWTDHKNGALDKTGKVVFPCTYKGMSIWDNGIVRVTNDDDTCDLYDASGNRLTETSYQAILPPVDSDYYLFERDGKWGVGVLAEPVAPSAPQGLSAAPGDGSLSLSWSAPASDGGSAVTGYSVYVGGEKVADLGADATSYAVTGLANGTSYDVSVTATSAAGEGEAATTSATPPRASRLWGQGALDTMAAVVDEGFTETGGAVVLATGDGYWDALAASGVAGLEGAPVLLTSLDGTTLSAQTRSELGRLAPSRVYVCGGEMAVPGSVLDEVRSVTGVEPRRLWGQDATGTAVSIYEAGEGRWSRTAIVATSQSFMDALSVAPYAYWAHAPIFLARPGDDRLSDETLAAIQEGGFERVVVVGGAMVVSPDVEGQLEGAGISDVKRLWGQACADTSLAIAEWEIGEGMGVSRMGVATDGVEEFVRTGRGYWDSLCGAALCGRGGCVLVIGHDGATQAIDGVLSEHASEVGSVRVFGGSAAVSDSLLARVTSYLG